MQYIQSDKNKETMRHIFDVLKGNDASVPQAASVVVKIHNFTLLNEKDSPQSNPIEI